MHLLHTFNLNRSRSRKQIVDKMAPDDSSEVSKVVTQNTLIIYLLVRLVYLTFIRLFSLIYAAPVVTQLENSFWLGKT
jgi:hypothetical protein